MLDRLIEQVAGSRDLTEEQVALAVELLADEAIAVESKADFLAHLARKGETTVEIAAFARCLRAKCIEAALDCPVGAGEILDVVGTGGDRLNTFNISTAAALVATAAGARVAKHGNRASTSKVGSADVLEALGIAHDRGPEEAARSFREHGFAFFF
ncbi:MAG: anthranilate phosphoribosyltransferase, partial [Verrucomicrobiota bacterium]